MRLPTRLAFAGLALLTIGIGLAVHFHGRGLGPGIQDVLGDLLWAMMMTWWIGAAAPAVSLGRRAAGSLVVCWVVEASQLFHGPAIDAIRRTGLGHLVLGSDFDWRDLFAYAVGVFLAAALERIARRR